MTYALGLVETKGLIGAITAADAMAKAADVKVIGKEKINPALVTIQVIGEVAAVRSAVEAGARAAQQVGQLVSTHIIPRPDLQLAELYPELLQEKVSSVSVPENFIETKTASEGIAPIEQVNEISVAVVSEDVAQNADEESNDSDINLSETQPEEAVTDRNTTDEVPASTTTILTDEDNSEPVVAEAVPVTEVTMDEADEVQEEVIETSEIAAEATPTKEEATIEEITSGLTDVALKTNAVSDREASEAPVTEDDKTEEVTVTETPVKKEKTSKSKKQAPDLFSVFDAPASKEEVAAEPEVNVTADALDVKQEAGSEVQNSVSETVQDDAGSEKLSTQPISENLKDIVEDVPSVPVEISVPEPVKENQTEVSPVTRINPELESKIKELEMRNVEELRRLARTHPDFPIKGRDISKAGRKDLLDYFRQIL